MTGSEGREMKGSKEREDMCKQGERGEEKKGREAVERHTRGRKRRECV